MATDVQQAEAWYFASSKDDVPEGPGFVVGGDLLAAARSSDAPEGVLERLEQLPTNAQFSDPDEVVEELENPQGTGEQGEAPPGEPAEA
jgi:uncharacterized protein DUF2795